MSMYDASEVCIAARLGLDIHIHGHGAWEKRVGSLRQRHRTCSY